MSKEDQLDRRNRVAAWGTFFILIGILSLIPGDQTGWAFLGIGIILLGLNLVRWLSRIPMGTFSLVLGAGTLLVAALVMFRSVLGLHFEIDLFPFILMAVGLYLLTLG